MERALDYRRMETGEEQLVAALVRRVFQEAVAPLFPQEGVDEFLHYVDPVPIRQRSQEDHFLLLAVSGVEPRKVVGVIEMRQCRHVSLLFVDTAFQRQGIARELLQRAIEVCQAAPTDVGQITVNASPNAVSAYERMGFRATSAQKQVNGILFMPMALDLVSPQGANQRCTKGSLALQG